MIRYDVDIRKLLPHRKPMLMVDKVLEINSEEVSTSFLIQADNIFLDENKFSEAGLIENCAQTCSAITGQNFFQGDEKPNVIGFISHIKKVKIHTLPEAGSEIIAKAKKISEFENICNISCQSFSGENLLLEAEIVMFLKKL